MGGRRWSSSLVVVVGRRWSLVVVLARFVGKFFPRTISKVDRFRFFLIKLDFRRDLVPPTIGVDEHLKLTDLDFY